jgi:hypothetical protein
VLLAAFSAPPISLGHEADTGFSGLRAVILVFVLVALVIGVGQLDLPGWVVAVGLLACGALLRAWEKRASS